MHTDLSPEQIGEYLVLTLKEASRKIYDTAPEKDRGNACTTAVVGKIWHGRKEAK